MYSTPPPILDIMASLSSVGAGVSQAASSIPTFWIASRTLFRCCIVLFPLLVSSLRRPDHRLPSTCTSTGRCPIAVVYRVGQPELGQAQSLGRPNYVTSTTLSTPSPQECRKIPTPPLQVILTPPGRRCIGAPSRRTSPCRPLRAASLPL